MAMTSQETKKVDAPKKIVILGAGPCGLGAAWRLHELIQSGLFVCVQLEGPLHQSLV